MGWKLIQQFYRRAELHLKVPAHEHSVYVFMLYTARDVDGTAIYPSMKTIAEVTNRTPRQARNIVRHLEEQGYIVRVTIGIGRSNAPLWHVPLDQAGWITPQPQPSDQAQKPPRRVHLVKPPADEFLDVDQASGQVESGKELTEYQAGYTPRQLRVVKVSEVSREEEYQAAITAELTSLAAKIEDYRTKAENTPIGASKRIMQRLLSQAEAEYQELLAEQNRQQDEESFRQFAAGPEGQQIEMRKYL